MWNMSSLKYASVEMNVWDSVAKILSPYSGSLVLSNAISLGESPPDLYFKAAKLKYKMSGTEFEQDVNDLFDSICVNITNDQRKKLPSSSSLVRNIKLSPEMLEKEKIIQAALDSAEGRKLLAQAMVEPL